MKTNMKKQFGFTLIELLVVIVIMGILATISTATFSSYFAKARDAKRISSIQNMKMLLQVDNADNWEPDRYAYDTVDKLQELFDDNDYRLPKPEANYCYFFGFGGGANEHIGDDNQFYVATYLEDEEKVLIDGTNGVVTALTDPAADATLAVQADFYCSADTLNGKADSPLGLENDTALGKFKYNYRLQVNTTTGNPELSLLP